MRPVKISTQSGMKRQLLVCRGTGCESQKSGLLYSSLKDELAKAGLSEKVEVIFTGCRGLCQMGPTVLVEPEGDLLLQGEASRRCGDYRFRH